jgi:hypothetical protein
MSEYSLHEALQMYLKNTPIKGQMQAAQIKQVWKDIMGITIANYTENIEIKDRILFIKCYAAPLRNELQYQRKTIIERVNEWFGEKAIIDIVVN